MKIGPVPGKSTHPALKLFWLLLLLYIFLVGITLMSSTFKAMGKGEADALLDGLKSPFAGLAVGILATVLVQSSSLTTSIVVTAVAGNVLPLDVAVYTIMGCNIGTTVTNTLVSLGHARQDAEFKRAFAGATMHDFFNLMAIAVFMPVEMATGFLKSLAGTVSHWLMAGEIGGGKFDSPIKASFKFVAKPIEKFFLDDFGPWLGLPTWAAGTVAILLALGMLFVALVMITKLMRSLMAKNLEKGLNAILGKSGILAIFIGMAMTVAVQSSSITTSLMVPLFAAGILTLEHGFPVTLGANIGTTVTGLIAALGVTTHQEAALTIALVHFFFNLFSTLLIYPFPAVRHIPIHIARRLAELTSRSRAYAILYVVVVFFLIPLLGILVTK
jgi:solute carrier family 34 (sodium-dependent phosphate cotransporter)